MALKLNKKNLAKMNAEQKKEYFARLEYVSRRREWQKGLKDGSLLPGTSWKEFQRGKGAQAKKRNEKADKPALAIVDQPVIGAGIAGLGSKLQDLGKKLIELDAMERSHLDQVAKVLAATGASLGTIRKLA